MFRKTASPVQTNRDIVITDAAPCQKSLRIRVGPEAAAPVRAAVLAEFQKEATLPGFRKGKAPAELVERQYATPIHEETVQRLTRQAIEQATREHTLKPVGPFEIRSAHFTDAEGLLLEAAVEVEPVFPLGAYKGIALTSQSTDVTREELERSLATLQESMAQLVPVGTGETKERKLPALDDELAKDLGFENLEKLREHVHAKLREQKRAAQRQAQEAALCEELLKRHAFEVPPQLVSHQTDRLTRDFHVRLLLSGVPEDKVGDEATKFREQLRDSAQRHVKLGFILDHVADAEAMTVTQDEVVKRVWELARRWKKDPAETRKIFDAQGLWPSVISTIRQEKTMALLMSSASINNELNKVEQPRG